MRTRVQLRRATSGVERAECAGRRPLQLSDVEPLGRLLYDAFHGGVDDEGEDVDDAHAIARDVFTEQSRTPARLDASFVVERAGRLVAAVVVSTVDGEPLISYLTTHPAWRRHGLGRALLAEALATLAEQGESSATLWVTSTNHGALALYEQLGFVAVPTAEV